MIKRLSGLHLAVSDLGAAVKTLQRNFGLKLERANGDREAVLTIGGAAITLIARPQGPAQPASSNEGMVGLWLEVQDADAVAASLASVGLGRPALKIDRGRRVLEIAPPGFTKPWLFLFDVRG